MSTLTSHSHSPSPAASPHSTFHIPNPPPPASKTPRELSRAHPNPVASRPYADAGTQYSPEGYPPTAGPEFKVAAG
ncbi:hypothetical protein KC316_g14690, partial [Hortaea werneckii]